MTNENLLKWLQRQNHKVLETNSSFWYDQVPYVFQAFPYHQVISPTTNEIASIFTKTHAFAIRYSAPLGNKQGQLSYHVIHEQNKYDLSSLPKKARHDIAHGLQHAAYEQISMTRLAKEGWKIRYETLLRQGRTNAENINFWQKLCMSA